MSRELALKLKAVFYSKPFLDKYGDWLAAGDEFMKLNKCQQTKEKKEELLKKYNIIIEIDEGFEPILTEELLEYVLTEYVNIYENFRNN